MVSSVDDRAVMASCLQLGAADFLIKPLRANELCNLWARVYWWRRVRPLGSPNLRLWCAGRVAPGMAATRRGGGAQDATGGSFGRAPSRATMQAEGARQRLAEKNILISRKFEISGVRTVSRGVLGGFVAGAIVGLGCPGVRARASAPACGQGIWMI